MFAQYPRTRAQRRGIVLVLVLAMMGLLALIGVTFATFSGQARVNARNFSQAQNWPDSAEMMDYALAQLIDDTDNPQSAIRGHSLKRDMYGNDAVFNSFLTLNPSTGLPFQITAVGQVTTATPITVHEIDGSVKTVNVFGLYKCITSIAKNDPAFYGYNFTRWIIRFPGQAGAATGQYAVGESHEIVVDDPHDTTPNQTQRVFYVAPWDSAYQPTLPTPPPIVVTQPTPLETPTYYNLAPSIPYPLPTEYSTTTPPAPPAPLPFYNSPEGYAHSTLIGLPTNVSFVLDGRFLHAFNGPGMSALDYILNANTSLSPQQRKNRGMAQYANFRYNGNIVNGNINATVPNSNPAYGFPNNLPGMDEDYDACDLENWFLALQSGDSQVMIPSFHRPGTLIADRDPKNPDIVLFSDWEANNTFSRSKILRPRAADGHSSVAFPNLYPDINTGQITYDVDNDGDGNTDSVWVDLGYPPKRSSEGQLYKPLFAFMIIGLNGRIPLNTAGNLQLRNVMGVPMNMHASGKGYSPSEIDPSYALQNAHSKTAVYTQVDNAGVSQDPTLRATWNSATNTFTPADGSGPTAAYPFPPPWGTSGIPVSLTQLRNILAGTRVQSFINNDPTQPANDDANWVIVNNKQVPLPNGVRDTGDNVALNSSASTLTPTVAGRWGESEDLPTVLAAFPDPSVLPPNVPPYTPPPYVYTNPVRAGLSGQSLAGGNPRFGDGRDDNSNTFDAYPPNTDLTQPITVIGESPYPFSNIATANTTPNYAGLQATSPSVKGFNADYFDASGSISLPVERIRRFLTPLDVAGDGLVNSFSSPYPAVTFLTAINTKAMPPLRGGDEQGRVSYWKHFRPPGLAVATSPGITLPTAPVQPNFNWFPYPSPTKDGNEILTPLNPDRTNNIYHGFEAARNPSLVTANLPAVTPPNFPVVSISPFHLGAMPSDNTPTAPAVFPTYDQFINTMNLAVPRYDSVNLNEADEMQLYAPTRFDEPFGPSDLEWLYRQQDTDGASLASRLNDLAPISFTNTLDGSRRRRLFSVESWEPTNFVLAHDIPLNDPQLPNLDNLANITNGVAKVQSRIAPVAFAPALGNNFSNFTSPAVALTPVSVPSIAQRDRKINLNFPLPVSNRYDEPVRQKWVRETYQLLKMILPPAAVDTPEELAQLSQFVVNILDFRDPDATATRFVNTDVYYSSMATATAPATLSFTPGAALAPGFPPLLDQTTLATLVPTSPFASASNPMPPSYSPLFDNKNSPYLVQYGMEYNPVAITEVLSYQFDRVSGGTARRMFIELTNTLTKPAAPNDTACNLELEGWDFVILPDDPTGRPDPYTGQLPYTGNTIDGVTLSNKKLSDIGGAVTGDIGGLAGGLEALDADGTDHPKVIESNPSPGADETGGPSGTTTLDLIANTIMNTGAPDKYYWLYLRRPANPFDTSYDPARPNENRVVVDCFRFMYTKADRANLNIGGVYSLMRLQPFRGGHAVPPIPAVTGAGNFCISAYGYSEQTLGTVDPKTTSFIAYYDKANSIKAADEIFHTLGSKKSDTEVKDIVDDSWELFPFHDRDFVSVAELLFVPGCPPGLFTKQFVELPPPTAFTTPGGTPSFKGLPLVDPPTVADNKRPAPPTRFEKVTKDPSSYTAPADKMPTPGTWPTDPPVLASNSTPRSFPYLVDRFFYTAQNEPMIFMTDNAQVPPNFRAKVPFDPTLVPPANTTTDVPYTGYYGVWPDPGNGPAPIKTDPTNFPATNGSYAPFPLATGDQVTGPPNYYRIRLPGDSRGGGKPYPSYIGGPSNAGWHKMFEFFEVPSPAFGSIGQVSLGMNYDWARQDLKPGLLNLNLIIDEEVFFAIMSESWLKTLNFTYSLTGGSNDPTTPNHSDLISPNQIDMDNMGDTRLNVAQLLLGGAPASTPPFVVTEVTSTGAVSRSFQMKNQGFTALDPSLSNIIAPTTVPVFDNKMKAAFADFLKLRHGGSGYMFAHQYGDVGDPNANPNQTAPVSVATSILASERPFRSLAYPDVNMTVMRPAALPPTASTILRPYLPAFNDWKTKKVSPDIGTDTATVNTYVGDPGVMNPYLFTQNDPVQSPPVPVRRLFEVPDVWGNVGYPQTTPSLPPSNASSKASLFTSPSSGNVVTYTGDANVNWLNQGPVIWTGVPLAPVANPILANPNVDLSALPTTNPNAGGYLSYVGSGPYPPPYAIVPNFYLGANTAGSVEDNRQHPYFRYEWLQKVMNLTTVRTHQFAVWITVGFFHVTQAGDASLGSTAKWDLAYDRLGQELNIQNGKNIRYRSFFIIDRTRAVGFSPQAPGNFRDCIVYRQSIE